MDGAFTQRAAGRALRETPGSYSFFTLRRVSALFCIQKLFFLSSAFHTLHFLGLQKTQRNAEHRSKTQNSAFSVDKRIRPGSCAAPGTWCDPGARAGTWLDPALWRMPQRRNTGRSQCEPGRSHPSFCSQHSQLPSERGPPSLLCAFTDMYRGWVVTPTPRAPHSRPVCVTMARRSHDQHSRRVRGSSGRETQLSLP